jgi:hypothetical protein
MAILPPQLQAAEPERAASVKPLHPRVPAGLTGAAVSVAHDRRLIQTGVMGMRSIALLLLTGICVLLLGNEATDREILRYNDAVSKLQKANDEGLAKEKARTLAALIPLARQRVHANDGAGASLAWQAVLSLDDGNAEARKYFTANGTLDAVLAKLKQEASADLPGPGDDKPDTALAPTAAPFSGTLVAISASKGVAVGVGALKAGTAITLRYVDGSWGRGAEAKPVAASPDDAGAPLRCRLRLTSDPRRADATMAVVPAGTATSPYTFTLDSDCDQLVLCINADAGDPLGSVHYRITVSKP